MLVGTTEYGYTVGTVVEVAPVYRPKDQNSAVPMPVRAGDRVVYRDYLKDLETVHIGGKLCCFIYIDDIAMRVEENSDGA